MVKIRQNVVVFSLLISLSLLLTNCGAATPAPQNEVAPTEAAQEAAPTEAPVVEKPATEAPTEAAAPATEAPVVEATEPATAEATEAAAASTFTLNPRIAERVANGEKLVFRVSYQDISNEFAPFIKKGVEKAVGEFDVDAELVGPVGSDADAQIAELESLVEAGVDGLAISSVSTDALAPVINRFLEQGIPVVAYNTDNPASDRLAFAGQDLVTSGHEAAKVLADLLGGEGDVIIITLDAAAQWSIDREGGARAGFAEYPGINVLQTINTGSEPQEMYGAIENAMLANPTVKGILSLECCSTPAAGEYVERNGLMGEVTVVGFDELPTTLDLIESGAIAGSVSQAPERQSYEAIKMLLDVVNAKPVKDVDTGIAVIDSTNLADYKSSPAAEATGEPEATAEAEAAAPVDFTLDPRIAERVANGEKLVFRVSYQDISNEFAPFIKKGVEKAVGEFDVDAELVGPVGSDADAQIAELESLVEAGVDGLAISSVSTDALAPVINRFLEQGIPVVAYNTDNPASDRLAFAGQDLVTSGHEAAKVLADLLGGEGDVIIITLDAAAQWSIDREGGARAGFAEYPGINVLQTVNTGSEPQEMYGAIENAMLANPTVKGILSLECCSTPAAGEYVERNGLMGEVTVVGFDELPTTLDLIESGAIAGSVSQAPERQSYEAIKMLLDVVNAKPVKDVDTGIAVINADNLSEFKSAQ